ncbi:lytic transglycosylase domain-containing protein [Paenibacillus lycopersici]|uniref:Lytic transglycosylase domain-containing protein n=2 Tax=Paenibacillus lycopersici TaxID=2704462 RepID=A0A6C0G825_9BACL|nr:lytic transglycosylase domain-containing protein [Paenibacillus lycopersici]
MDIVNQTGNLGAGPSQNWGSLVNNANSGSQTMAGQNQQYNQNMQQEQFKYQKARDTISDKQWQQKFDEDVRQYGLNYGLQQLQLNNDEAYRKAQLALSQDDNDRQWASLDAQLSGTADQAKAVSGDVAGNILAQSLQKVVGTDPVSGKPVYGTISDPTAREKAFIDAWNTSGVAPGADTVTMLSKAGYTAQEIANLKSKYPVAFNSGGPSGGNGSPANVSVPLRYQEMLSASNSKYGLPDGLLAAVANKESSFNPSAKNSKSGAAGMFQFMPATAKGYGIDPMDPRQSADAAGKMLSGLAAKYDGDYSKALAAYNWGGGNVDKAIKVYGANWLSHAPAETQKYVSEILG